MRASVRKLVGSLIAGMVTAGVVAMAPTAANATPALPGTRAMWLWSRADPAAVVSWANAHGVREIFAYVTPDLPFSGDLPRLQELKLRTDAAGITLSALGGDPGWVFDHTAALAWQSTALGTGLFAKAHVDVEPYALAEWYADQPATVASFLSLLDEMQALDPTDLEVDVPFWYSTIPAASGNVADQVLSRVDAVTVMSYRDTATGVNSMMDVGTDMLTRGAAVGKPVRLAAETQNMPDCAHCTFYEQGQLQMGKTLSKVDTAAKSFSTFAGIAIHHYNSWLALAP